LPHLALSVETASSLFALRRRLRFERMLSNVAAAITSGRSVRESLSAAPAELSAVMDAALIALVPVHASPVLWHTEAVAPAMEQRLLARAAEQPERWADVMAPHHAGDPGWAALHLPVKLAGRRMGTLSIMRSRAEPFNAAEQD